MKPVRSDSLSKTIKLPVYQVDAFADKVFSGNPAAVVPLNKWLPDTIMQKIASENNLSETAFFVPEANGFFIRWFTPKAEVDLCGHATLAAAHVLFNHLGFAENEIKFNSRSGILKVKSEGKLLYLDFPASNLVEIPIPAVMKGAFNTFPKKWFRGRDDLMLVFDHEKDVRNLVPDMNRLAEAKTRGIICTASSNEFDFVSRFFAPAVGIEEDPVTGSAHTMLIPYWAKKLGKKELVARQVSARGGTLFCRNLNERVEIGGKAVTFLEGEITIWL